MLWYCFLYVFILPFFDQKAIKCSIYFHVKKISAPNASLLFLIFPCNKMPALFFLLPAMPSVTPFEVFLKLPASFSAYHGLKFILYRWSLPAPTPQKGQPGRGFLYICDMNIWQSCPFLFPSSFPIVLVSSGLYAEAWKGIGGKLIWLFQCPLFLFQCPHTKKGPPKMDDPWILLLIWLTVLVPPCEHLHRLQ